MIPERKEQSDERHKRLVKILEYIQSAETRRGENPLILKLGGVHLVVRPQRFNAGDQRRAKHPATTNRLALSYLIQILRRWLLRYLGVCACHNTDQETS